MVFLFFEKVNVNLLPGIFSVNAGSFLYIIFILLAQTLKLRLFPFSASIYKSLKITVTFL